MENSKLCSLCFGQVLNDTFEKLDSDKIRNLKIRLSLNVTRNEDIIICSKCAHVYHLSCNFKATCINNNDYLKTFMHPSVDKKLILEEIILKKIKSELNCEEKVCRFCLNYFEASSLVEVNTEHNVILKDMLEKCLSELELDIVQNSFICNVCMETLEKFFNFIPHCEDIEMLTKLKTENKNFIIDLKTNITTEGKDDYVDNSFVKKEEYCRELQNPEIQIKTEDTSELEEEELKFNESNSVCEASEIEVNQSTNAEKKFACDMCPFQTSRKYNLTHHYYKIHEEIKESMGFKCDKCKWVTKWKSSLVKHYEKHKNPSEVTKYRCDKCPYETNWMKNIKRHKVRHLSPLERVLHKCTECPFQTKCKQYLQKHIKKHELSRTKSVEVYICNECDWKTNYKHCLVRHLKQHQENTYFSKGFFYCRLCSYVSNRRLIIENHYKVHQNQAESKQYKCAHCSYVATFKGNLLRHLDIHKDSSERKMYKCTECPYQVLQKKHLKRHYEKNHGEFSNRKLLNNKNKQ